MVTERSPVMLISTNWIKYQGRDSHVLKTEILGF